MMSLMAQTIVHGYIPYVQTRDGAETNLEIGEVLLLGAQISTDTQGVKIHCNRAVFGNPRTKQLNKKLPKH